MYAGLLCSHNQVNLFEGCSEVCSSCNVGMSDLPEIYTRAQGHSPSVSAYISGKSQVPMLQLIYSTWVIHLQVYMETAGMLCECRDHVNFDCG